MIQQMIIGNGMEKNGLNILCEFINKINYMAKKLVTKEHDH
jgi:hypothetical protein